MTTVTWKKPAVPGAPLFAEWDEAKFGLVRQAVDGRWRASIFPDGDTSHSKDVYLATEEQAKLAIVQWARRNHALIRPVQRTRMPHEGELKPRKPKGSEDRS